MPPRKVSDTAAAAEPRRSGRIASQPATPAVPEPKPKLTKKRSAEEAAEADGEGSTVKKAKPEAENAGPDAGSSSALPTIDIGGNLPDLILTNEKGEDVQISTLAAEKGVVLFLVPKADTPGCTTQACGFRDSYPDFGALNYIVYGLSADTPTAQQKWQTKKELPYPLISDPKRILITALGAGTGGKTQRSHFVFEKGGKLADKKVPVKPADSPRLAMEFIKSRVEPPVETQ